MDILRSTVGFIGFGDDFRGTVFIVSVHGSQDHHSHLYLVTAKHIVDAIAGRECSVRMNLSAYASVNKDIRAPLITLAKGTRWFFHPDTPNAVDAAVLPIQTRGVSLTDHSGSFLGSALPMNLSTFAATNDDMKTGRIQCGSEGFIVGMFKRHVGAEKNIPIVRLCSVAATDYGGGPLKIDATGFADPIDAYLIEVRSIGGLSGSPVFIKTEHRRDSDQKPGRYYLLLGLIHGHWDVERGPFSKASKLQDDEINSGIAIVTPIQKVVETINHPELVAIRKKIEVEAKRNRRKSTPDLVPDTDLQIEIVDLVDELTTPEELIQRVVNTPPMKKKAPKRKGKA